MTRKVDDLFLVRGCSCC